MAIFNNQESPLKRYLIGLHQLKSQDADVMLKLLQGGKVFSTKEVIEICRSKGMKNYEREGYNTLSRLEKEDLVWKLDKTDRLKKQNYYERIEIQHLQKELEDGVDQLKSEIVNLKEATHYIPEDPKENTRLLRTERKLVTNLIKLKDDGFDYKIYLTYNLSMPSKKGESYKRFISKLKKIN